MHAHALIHKEIDMYYKNIIFICYFLVTTIKLQLKTGAKLKGDKKPKSINQMHAFSKNSLETQGNF